MVSKKINCQISQELFDEIKNAQNHLNDLEKQKARGYKKRTYSFIETSRKIGKYLKHRRDIAKKSAHDLSDF